MLCLVLSNSISIGCYNHVPLPLYIFAVAVSLTGIIFIAYVFPLVAKTQTDSISLIQFWKRKSRNYNNWPWLGSIIRPALNESVSSAVSKKILVRAIKSLYPLEINAGPQQVFTKSGTFKHMSNFIRTSIRVIIARRPFLD